MNNREKFLSGTAGEIRETLAKAFDKAQAAKKSGRAAFTPFLSEREYGEFSERKRHIDDVNVTAFGGYEASDRVMLCFSDFEADFPISAVCITGKGIDKLKHPDFLGSLMSLGIERCCVGDIVNQGSEWIVFAEEGIAQFIASSLTQVGGVYVNCAVKDTELIKTEQHFEEITGTVASLRADSVISVMLKTSRSKAAEYIEAQKFFLNQSLCTKCDKEIKENDVLSVRRMGKAKVKKISGLSKKGRIFITIQKYM